MSSRQPESQLVFAIRKAIECSYPSALVFKVHGSPFQASGIPDLLVFIEGRTFALEVKRQKPGESMNQARSRVTPIQAFTIMRFRKAGIAADCVLSPAEALAVIQSNGDIKFLEAGRPTLELGSETA